MIARLRNKLGMLIAELGDDGVWVSRIDLDPIDVAYILNSGYSPNDPERSHCGDHHLGYGVSAAHEAAVGLGLTLEIAPRPDLPEGVIS